jgi:hypothetical protein
MDSQVMQTERRACRRVAVSIDAVVYYSSLMLPDCHIRDLTPEGAFISTRGHFLPDRALVDLAIQVPNGGTQQRFTAQVMRSTEEGVGIRLQDANPATLRRLIEALYAA